MDGLIGISRYNNCDHGKPILITIHDKSSGVRLIEVSLSLEDFALAITNVHGRDCSYDLNKECPIGKKREVKTEKIIIKGNSYGKDREIIVKEATKPYEVEGWQARITDASNCHNISKYNKDSYEVNVTFIRFV